MNSNLIDITNFKEYKEGIYLYAFGGIPFTRPMGIKEIEKLIIQGVGASAILTYENPNNKTIEELGTLCIKKGHRWAYKWMTLSFLICGKSKLVEMAFLRDSNFFQSWTVKGDDIRFGISGTLSSFRKFVNNKNDLSFDEQTRNCLKELNDKFGMLWQ